MGPAWDSKSDPLQVEIIEVDGFVSKKTAYQKGQPDVTFALCSHLSEYTDT